jgi:zinc transport system substrate-binding protein
MENSRLIIFNGLVEPWIDKIKQNIDPDKTLIITPGADLLTQYITEEGENMTDPHIWLSPRLTEQISDEIAKTFIQLDPQHTSEYTTNLQSLKSALQELDAAYQQGLSHCEKKDIITSHASFGYLASAYGLNQVSIAGLSPDAEPSSQQLADIADFAKANDIKIIFFEELVSPKLSQTIAAEVGADTMALNPLEGITDDDMAVGKNYLTEMYQNLDNLKIALVCTP